MNQRRKRRKIVLPGYSRQIASDIGLHKLLSSLIPASVADVLIGYIPLQELEVQTEANCLAAVRHDGLELQHVKLKAGLFGPGQWLSDQTHAIRLAAVRQNGLALQYASVQFGVQTEEVMAHRKAICLAAVEQNGLALEFVGRYDHERVEYISEWTRLTYFFEGQEVNPDVTSEQTPEICMAAVMQNVMALRYVKVQTPEIIQAAVEQDGRAVKWAQAYNRLIHVVSQRIYKPC